MSIRTLNISHDHVSDMVSWFLPLHNQTLSKCIVVMLRYVMYTRQWLLPPMLCTSLPIIRTTNENLPVSLLCTIQPCFLWGCINPYQLSTHVEQSTLRELLPCHSQFVLPFSLSSSPLCSPSVYQPNQYPMIIVTGQRWITNQQPLSNKTFVTTTKFSPRTSLVFPTTSTKTNSLDVFTAH